MSESDFHKGHKMILYGGNTQDYCKISDNQVVHTKDELLNRFENHNPETVELIFCQEDKNIYSLQYDRMYSLGQYNIVKN